MSFRFNFNIAENLEEISQKPKGVADANECEKILHGDCKYISVDSLTWKVDGNKCKKIKCGNYEIKYLTEELISNTPSYLNKIESDLLPNQYEGGFKVWECSLDLLNYISTEICIHADHNVLELGCGVGLPGLFSYLCGANVTFQDFNSEVLELITAPSVYLNTDYERTKDISNKCKFLCGDWEDIQTSFFPDQNKNELFDVILTSETIYNRASQKKLLNLMKHSLKQDGIIYVAAKSHYFGVGGGVGDFEELLKEDNTFDFSTIQKLHTGLERAILKLTFKNDKNK